MWQPRTSSNRLGATIDSWDATTVGNLSKLRIITGRSGQIDFTQLSPDMQLLAVAAERLNPPLDTLLMDMTGVAERTSGMDRFRLCLLCSVLQAKAPTNSPSGLKSLTDSLTVSQRLALTCLFGTFGAGTAPPGLLRSTDRLWAYKSIAHCETVDEIDTALSRRSRRLEFEKEKYKVMNASFKLPDFSIDINLLYLYLLYPLVVTILQFYIYYAITRLRENDIPWIGWVTVPSRRLLGRSFGLVVMFVPTAVSAFAAWLVVGRAVPPAFLAPYLANDAVVIYAIIPYFVLFTGLSGLTALGICLRMPRRQATHNSSTGLWSLLGPLSKSGGRSV